MSDSLSFPQIPTNSEFNITYQHLLELAEIEPNLDKNKANEVLNSSEYALETAKELLIKLSKKLEQNFPCGVSNLESRGGINLIWTNKEFDKKVILKIPISPELTQVLSSSQGKDEQVLENPSLEQIYDRLIWLQTDADLSQCIESPNSDKIEDDSAAWQAYLKSEKEWEEVYRRLANS